MNFFAFCFLLFFHSLTQANQLYLGASIYKLSGTTLKIYSSAADLTEVYRVESNATDDSAKAMRLYKKNLQDLANFNALKFKSVGADLDEQTLTKLQKNLMGHPVAGRMPYKNYDDANMQVGFCYGRALLVQKELERLGVSPGRIFKVFLVGELVQQNVLLWDYHVATMYIDKDGQKLIIDSLHDQVLTLSDWFKSMHEYFLNPQEPRVRIYFAEANKFQARTGEFTSNEMFNPIYNSYFFDLALWL